MKFNDKWFIPAFLVALTILAVIIRYFKLGFNDWFIDEAWSVYVGTQPIYMSNGLDVHPFLSYILIRIPLTLFGVSEWSSRLMPCIFGIIAVPLTYWFAKEFTGKKLPGLIAALLMTCSIFEIEQSHNARMYTFLTVFCILAMIYFLKAYRENKPKYWYITTAFAILMIFTWYYSVIIIGITLLWYFLMEGRKPFGNKGFLYSAIAFVFACVLMLPSFLTAISLKSTENNNLIYLGPETIWQTLITYFGSPPLLAVLIAVIAIAGGILLIKDDEVAGTYLAFVTFVALAVGFFISYELMYLPRYAFFIAPIAYTLIGYFIYKGYDSSKVKWQGAIAAGFILLIVVASFCMVIPGYFAVKQNYSGNFDDMKDSFAEIKGNVTTVAMVGNPAFVLMYQYYIKDPSITVVRFDNLTRLQAAIDGKPSLVLIPDYPVPNDQPEAKVIHDWLEANGEDKFTYRGFVGYDVDIDDDGKLPNVGIYRVNT